VSACDGEVTETPLETMDLGDRLPALAAA
jgi:hypothetical protein